MLYTAFKFYMYGCTTAVTAGILSVVGFGAYAYWRLATRGDE